MIYDALYASCNSFKFNLQPLGASDVQMLLFRSLLLAKCLGLIYISNLRQITQLAPIIS
jgi:hypothetical protein